MTPYVIGLLNSFENRISLRKKIIESNDLFLECRERAISPQLCPPHSTTGNQNRHKTLFHLSLISLFTH